MFETIRFGRWEEYDVNLDQELEYKGSTVLQMYLTAALDSGNVEVSSKIEAILKKRGEVDGRNTKKREG